MISKTTRSRRIPLGSLLRGDDDQSKKQSENLSTDNDDPPYSATIMPGTRANMPAPLTTFYGRLAQLGGNNTSTNVSTGIPQFEAPLGLIRVEIDAESSTASHGGIHFHFDTEIMGTI